MQLNVIVAVVRSMGYAQQILLKLTHFRYRQANMIAKQQRCRQCLWTSEILRGEMLLEVREEMEEIAQID